MPPPAERARPAMAATPSATPPPSVADVDGAQSWYYRDDAGGEQGPFPATNMRSWLLHGMLPGSGGAEQYSLLWVIKCFGHSF